MSDRQDLRRQTREIHESLSRFEREQLVDILTHVFRTYVMEGAALAPPPPASIGEELAGLSFAQVIERLQLRLDLPELQLFEVQGSRVSVRLDGRLQPLETPTSRTEAPSRNAPPPGPAAAPPPPASPGVERQELRQEMRPSAPPPPGVIPAGHASSPRPEASARPPAGRATSASLANAAAARSPGPAEKPAPAAPAPAKPAEKQDDGNQGGRFGLLEID